jgi:hypothetical protein
MQLPTEPQADGRRSDASDTAAEVIRATEGERFSALAQRDMHTAEQLHAENFQVAEKLQRVLEVTGARRSMVEMFSDDRARLFAREVLPARRTFSPTTAKLPV